MAKYELIGYTLTFSEGAERYYDLLNYYWSACNQAKPDFQSWYQNCANIVTVLKQYESIANKLLDKWICTPLYELLLDAGMYEILEEDYRNRCSDEDDLEKSYQIIAEQNNRIIQRLNAEKNRREERMNNRSTWEGGGFGLTGALKGAATAGALNMASGMGHGIVNAMGNIGSEIKAEEAQEKLYKAEDTANELWTGIKNYFYTAVQNHVKMINMFRDDYYRQSFDCTKGKALFENAKRVPQKEEDLLTDSFLNYPWNAALLEYIFEKYPDDRKNVWKISKRFEVNISDAVKEVIGAEYTKAAQQNEQAALQARKKILALMSEYEISQNDTLDKLEQDCLKRISSKYEANLADPEKRAEAITDFQNYDALDRNKAVVVKKRMLYELSKKYGVEFDESEKEAVLLREYTGEARTNDAAALQARKRILAQMDALGMEQSGLLDQIERDCLGRICDSYEANLADPEKRAEAIEAFRNYNALERNKAVVVKKRMLYELAQQYAVEFDELEKETILLREYTGEAKTSDAAALQVKERILAQMTAFGMLQSNALNQLEQDCLDRLCGKEGTREEIITAFKAYPAMECNKTAVAHKWRLWEVAEAYHISFKPEEMEEIFSDIYSGEAKTNDKAALQARNIILELAKTFHCENSQILNQLEKDCLNRHFHSFQGLDEASARRMYTELEAYPALEDNKAFYFTQLYRVCPSLTEEGEYRQFLQFFMSVSPDETAKKDKYIQYIEKNFSSDRKDQYISAFRFLDSSSVKSSAKYKIAQESGKKSIVDNWLFMRKSSYYLLTCNDTVYHPALLYAIEEYKQGRKPDWNQFRAEMQRKKAEVEKNLPDRTISDTEMAGSCKYCSSCGTKLPAVARFCTNCGKKQD